MNNMEEETMTEEMEKPDQHLVNVTLQAATRLTHNIAYPPISSRALAHEMNEIGIALQIESGEEHEPVFRFNFKHKIDKDVQQEDYSFEQVLFGVGNDGELQSIEELIGIWEEDGYVLTGVQMGVVATDKKNIKGFSVIHEFKGV